MQESLTRSIPTKIEEDWDDCYNFLQEAILQLKFKANEKEALEIRNRLKDIASNYHIKFSDPIFICVLSCLYGGEHANAILKPEKQKTKDNIKNATYNSLNDLNVIHRLIFIRRRAMNLGCKYVMFLTLDKGLDNFMSKVYFNSKDKTIEYDKSLFPELSKDKYNELMILLGAKYPSNQDTCFD